MSETQKPISGTPHRDKSDEGYRKGLKSRHMRMIALGGAIGSGLFYGASGRIADGGAVSCYCLRNLRWDCLFNASRPRRT